jgi:hypothetical protein
LHASYYTFSCVLLFFFFIFKGFAVFLFMGFTKWRGFCLRLLWVYDFFPVGDKFWDITSSERTVLMGGDWRYSLTSVLYIDTILRVRGKRRGEGEGE